MAQTTPSFCQRLRASAMRAVISGGDARPPFHQGNKIIAAAPDSYGTSWLRGRTAHVLADYGAAVRGHRFTESSPLRGFYHLWRWPMGVANSPGRLVAKKGARSTEVHIATSGLRARVSCGHQRGRLRGRGLPYDLARAQARAAEVQRAAAAPSTLSHTNPAIRTGMPHTNALVASPV